MDTRIKMIVGMIVGILLAILGLACLAFVAVSLIQDLSIWVLGQRTMAILLLLLPALHQASGLVLGLWRKGNDYSWFSLFA